MNTRFNYVKPETRDSSKDDEFSEFSYETKIVPISKNEDGSIDKYEEKTFWKEKKSSWKEFIDSYSIGSVQEQVMDHIKKGTPLITAHTLPAADYTQLEKGAQIKREMSEKGITIDMIVQAVNDSLNKNVQEVKTSDGGAE